VGFSRRARRAFSMETVVLDFLDSINRLQAPMNARAIEADAEDSIKAALLHQFFTRCRGTAPIIQVLGEVLAETLQEGVEGKAVAVQLQGAKETCEKSLRVYNALRSVAARRAGALKNEEIEELGRYAREAQGLLDWIQPLLARIQVPRTFDPSRLPPAP